MQGSLFVDQNFKFIFLKTVCWTYEFSLYAPSPSLPPSHSLSLSLSLTPLQTHTQRERERDTEGSHVAMVHFTMIYFYDPCRVRPSTPKLWCLTVATQVSFLYLVRLQLFSGMHVFLLFLFQCSSFKMILTFPPMTSIKKTKKKKIKTVDMTFFLDVFLTTSWAFFNKIKSDLIICVICYKPNSLN